ncbi:MAG: hypothetical protein J5632_00470 [Bacteroidales bacterium]|nr:hypothetical protein [Bacteroidales bacterium]
MKALILLLVSLFAPLTVVAQPQAEEPVIGKITQILPSSTAVCVDGNYMYSGQYKGVINVFDITNPKSPVEIGSVSFPGQVRQMVPYNGKLFVSARETGVWIFDISEPAKISLISRYDGVELSTGIDAAGDAIFVGERMTGVEFVDGRNLQKAQHIRIIKTPESQSVFYSNGYLYSGEWASAEVTIFDARDLSDIKKVKVLKLQGFGDGIWVKGDRLYASTGHHHRNHAQKLQNGDGHGVEIWDVSNPENPKFISRTEFDIFYKMGIDYWLPRPSGDGKTLFCGDVYNGMYVLDISNERNPKILDRWVPGHDHAVTSMAIADGVLYMSVSGEGLYALESPLAKACPRDRGILPTGLDARFQYPTSEESKFEAWLPDVRRGSVKSAAPYKDALFVGAGDAGLYTVKLDKKGKPYTFATLDIPFACGVAVKGDLLFVGQGEAGLGVYRIGEDLRLTLLEMVKKGLNPGDPSKQFSYWVTIPNDKFVVNCCRTGGYQFLALNDTGEKPKLTYRRQYSLNLNYNRYIAESVAPGDLLAYSTRSGLVWIDLSNPAAVDKPKVYGELKNSLTEGCTLYKDGKVLLSRHEGFGQDSDRFFALVNPGEAEIIDISNSNRAFEGIPRWDGDNTIVVCNFVSMYVSKVNAASFGNCRVEFREKTIGYPEPGVFWNGKCVVPCGFQGLLIEKGADNGKAAGKASGKDKKKRK